MKIIYTGARLELPPSYLGIDLCVSNWRMGDMARVTYDQNQLSTCNALCKFMVSASLNIDDKRA